MARAMSSFLYCCACFCSRILSPQFTGLIPSAHGFLKPVHGFLASAHGFPKPVHGFLPSAHGFPNITLPPKKRTSPTKLQNLAKLALSQ